MRSLKRMESFSQAFIYGTGAILAAAALRTSYVRLVRLDVPVDASRMPILQQLQQPVHASHR
jgi:hypothetical protein